MAIKRGSQDKERGFSLTATPRANRWKDRSRLEHQSMQVDPECNVAAQCVAAMAAIAAWRPLDVFRHANNITRFAKATICNETDVANATAAVREVVDALEEYISRENVEHGAAAGQAEQPDPFSNLRKTLAVAAGACSVVGSGMQVVQAKHCIAQTMGLPLNALARKGEPIGCPDRYFEPSVADPPSLHTCGLWYHGEERAAQGRRAHHRQQQQWRRCARRVRLGAHAQEQGDQVC